jgi:hypothetical protein
VINLDLGINALAPSFYPGADSVAGGRAVRDRKIVLAPG